jgi:hypothetical protein
MADIAAARHRPTVSVLPALLLVIGGPLSWVPHVIGLLLQLTRPTEELSLTPSHFFHLTAVFARRPESTASEQPLPGLPFKVLVYGRIGLSP